MAGKRNVLPYRLICLPLISAVCLFEIFGCCLAQSEGSPTATGFEIDYNSRYIWRGLPWSEGPVIQPSFWISAHNLTFSCWGNFVTGEEANRGQLNELDLVLTYEHEWHNISIEPSFEYYSYPNQDPLDSPSTGQGILRLSLPIGAFAAFTSHSFDMINYPGAYFGDIGLSYENRVSDKILLSISSFIGWGSFRFNDVYAGLGKDALNVAEGNISINFDLTDSIYLKPHIETSTLIDSDLRSAAANPVLTNAGISAGMEF